MVAWVTSLSIVGLVPVDVLDSLQGTSGSITGPLGILWSISYWYVCYKAVMNTIIVDASTVPRLDPERRRTTQVLCWAVVPITMGFVDAGEFTFAGRYESWSEVYVSGMRYVLLFSTTVQILNCRSWAGLKDHAQYWIIMGCLGGAGRSWLVLFPPASQAGVPKQHLSSHVGNAAGLLLLLISGRLMLSNVSPLALTLSNTYGRWNMDM